MLTRLRPNRNTGWGGYLLTGGLAALWAIGVVAAILGGSNPGKVRRDIIHPYPFVAVTATCGIITVEAVALCAILRPPTYSQHPRRAVAALAIFVPWCVAEFFFMSGWTDRAGYCYANGLFLRWTLVFLLVIACLGFLARTRSQTHRSSMPR